MREVMRFSPFGRLSIFAYFRSDPSSTAAAEISAPSGMGFRSGHGRACPGHDALLY
jgi:hypothetical protein